MDRWHRRWGRLDGWDYSCDGVYFVTVNVRDRLPILGEILEGVMHLNDLGGIVADAWRWLPSHFESVALDEWCVMPDHMHAIVILRPGKPLGQLIGAFKTVSTKRINQWRRTPGASMWQRGFWDHIVRDEADLSRIRRYIRDNASNWRRR